MATPETMAELEKVSPTIARLRKEMGADFEREMERLAKLPPPKSTWSGGHRPNSRAQRKTNGKPSRVQTHLALTLQMQPAEDES